MKELLILGSAVGIGVLTNHGPEFDVRQVTYQSREDCLNDWGDADSCTAHPAGGGAYVGPRYYWDPARNRPVTLGADGSERVAVGARVDSAGSMFGRTASVGTFARGGFGHIGRGFSAGRGG